MGTSYRKVCIAVFLGVMGLAVLTGLVRAQPPARGDYAALAATLEQQGVLQLIVTLDVDWNPEVYSAQVSAAQAQEAEIARAQDEVTKALDGQNVSELREFTYVPQMAVTVNSLEALDALFRAPQVRLIQEDIPVPPSLGQSVPLIRADAAGQIFFDGSDWTVAVLDTGIDKNHPSLQGRVVSEACFSTTNATANFSSVCPGGQDTTAVNSGLNCPLNISGCDHGTHVGGIVAGVAQGADLISIQVFSRVDDVPGNTRCANAGITSPCTLANSADIIGALERVFALRNSFNIAAVNMSLGGGRFGSTCDNDNRKPAIDLLRSAGIITVIAAGNAGFTDSMAAPACISTAVSVASSNKNDTVSSFSNLNNFTTLLAPGGNILAPVPGTGQAFKSGTSMAAPHVAAALAILRQAGPDQTANFLEALLEFNGPPVQDNRVNGFVTKRRLDVYSALCGMINCGLDDFQTRAIPSTTNGQIDQAGDRDFHYVQAAASSRLTIQMNALGSAIDPYLELYDPNGRRIVINNNGGSGSNALINGTILPITGRYTIVTRSVNNNTGGYQLILSTETLRVNPSPFVTRLAPTVVTGSFNSGDFWVRIDGRNFTRQSRALLNGSQRSTFFSTPNMIWIRVLGSDIRPPWPSVRLVTVVNPAPGGGSSPPVPLSISFPFLGESELVEPQPETTIETGVETTFTISWTTPISIPSWRNMQFMDLRLRDDEGNVAAWVRVRELPGEDSTYRLVNGAEVSVSTELTGTQPGPDEGLPGEDRTIDMPGYVALNLANSSFSGSGRTAIMSPALTFGPDAVGTYNIEFRVDGEDGTVQDDDVLGQLTIVPAECPVAVGDVTLSGPDTGMTGSDYVYTASVEPANATAPLSYVWSPEPVSGQGTAVASYRWETAGDKAVTVNVENCGSFGGATSLTRIRTTESPDLAIVKTGPVVAEAGEPITYTLRITNSGAMTATNLEITDVLPAGAVYEGGGTLVGDLVVWNLAELGGYGTTADVQFVVSANETITNSIINVTADGDYSAFRTDPVVTGIVDDRAAAEPLADTMLDTGTASMTTVAELPAGAVANPTTVALDGQMAPTEPLPANMQFAGRAFSLSAVVDNRAMPGMTLNEPISLTVGYDGPTVNGSLAAAGADAVLTLVYWNGSSWQSGGLTCAADSAPDTLACRFDTPIATEFALVMLDESAVTERVFLPIVQK
jgi:uncharacterized repeat protein (TIGR01451 family)